MILGVTPVFNGLVQKQATSFGIRLTSSPAGGRGGEGG